MKISRRSPRYSLSFSVHRYPWNLNKLLQFKKRKWARTSSFLQVSRFGRSMNFKKFQTYKKKTKKLIQRYFASNLTSRQCQKLFSSNPRLQTTLRQVLKSESRLDVLVFRLYMLPNIALARDLINKNFFLINGKPLALPKLVIQPGDVVSPSNQTAWRFLYFNMLSALASLKKYFSRVFF